MDTISTKSANNVAIQPTVQSQLNPTISHLPLSLPVSNEPLSRVPIKQEPLSPINQEPLSHLPEPKRQQLLKAVELILASNINRPSMLILFGSYARGDWLEALTEDGVSYQYQSHFDVLVVMKHEAWAKKLERKTALHNQLEREVATPVSVFAEDLCSINRRIEKGQYFYTDMLRDGIVLYDSGEYALAQPRVFAPAEKKQQAEADFAYWFAKAMIFRKGFVLYFFERDYSEAAFLLHQIAERLYGAILLVFGRYKPNSHDSARLAKCTASIEPQFLSVFPQSTQEEKAKFELLRKAYVNARYRPSFHITQHDLAWLASRVSYLQTLTEQLCRAKIASYQ